MRCACGRECKGQLTAEQATRIYVGLARYRQKLNEIRELEHETNVTRTHRLGHLQQQSAWAIKEASLAAHRATPAQVVILQRHLWELSVDLGRASRLIAGWAVEATSALNEARTAAGVFERPDGEAATPQATGSRQTDGENPTESTQEQPNAQSHS